MRAQRATKAPLTSATFVSIHDAEEGGINGVQKPFSGGRRSCAIPIEGLLDLLPCERANAQREHLAKLSEQSALNIRPCVAGFGRRIRLHLPALKVGGQVARDRRRARRVEAIPQLAHQLNALVGGECVEAKRPGYHIGTM